MEHTIGRFKVFQVLALPWRGELEGHALALYAVMHLVQISFNIRPCQAQVKPFLMGPEIEKVLFILIFCFLI